MEIFVVLAYLCSINYICMHAEVTQYLCQFISPLDLMAEGMSYPRFLKKFFLDLSLGKSAFT